ncbi:hypothetical protein [Streptomyces rubiginosohelvolus]
MPTSSPLCDTTCRTQTPQARRTAPATGTDAFRDAHELQAAQFRAASPAVPSQPGPGTDATGATAAAEGTAPA